MEALEDLDGRLHKVDEELDKRVTGGSLEEQKN
jgi:hypothetical protein